MVDFTRPNLSASDLAALTKVRAVETARAVAACGSDLTAAYWAQSASASVLRDVKAGRVITIRAESASATRARKARNAAALRNAVPTAR